MKSVLSTIKINKKLEKSFRENNIELTQHDFIKTEIKNFDIPKKYKNWIFTSKNAVNAVFSSKYKINYKNYNYYCVGENTEHLLTKNGQKVLKMANNSIKLANFIKKNNKKDPYLYFRGSIKNDHFSNFFKKNDISLKEVIVYKTYLTPKKMEKKFDGIMFFSPSGVKSFRVKNEIKNSMCFCIGNTTLNYLQTYSQRGYSVKTPSIENVVNRTIHYFNHD